MFDAPVSPNGYRWWYLDVVSDDGEHALTLIVFVGCVFSPFYFAARARGATRPQAHPAWNVALYGPRGQRGWVLTERDAAALHAGRDHFLLGPNRLGWEGDDLVARFDERTAPLGFPLRGAVRLHAGQRFDHPVALDPAGRHHWRAVAPFARAEVTLDEPRLAFSGSAYHDMNWGEEPLEAAFRSWDWSRAEVPDGAVVLYDSVLRGGGERPLALRFGQDGTVAPVEVPRAVPLPRTAWWLARSTRCDAGGEARVAWTLEDTPFYQRSVVDATLLGHRARGIHESVDLDRFVTRTVQLMLPFRMRRELSP
jgi:carotenoid 1,2-hydratase